MSTIRAASAEEEGIRGQEAYEQLMDEACTVTDSDMRAVISLLEKQQSGCKKCCGTHDAGQTCEEGQMVACRWCFGVHLIGETCPVQPAVAGIKRKRDDEDPIRAKCNDFLNAIRAADKKRALELLRDMTPEHMSYRDPSDSNYTVLDYLVHIHTRFPLDVGTVYRQAFDVTSPQEFLRCRSSVSKFLGRHCTGLLGMLGIALHLREDLNTRVLLQKIEEFVIKNHVNLYEPCAECSKNAKTFLACFERVDCTYAMRCEASDMCYRTVVAYQDTRRSLVVSGLEPSRLIRPLVGLVVEYLDETKFTPSAIREVNGVDVINYANSESLNYAFCISRDAAMNTEVAADFKRRYIDAKYLVEGSTELCVGGLEEIHIGDNPEYFAHLLITKEKETDPPSVEQLSNCLVRLRENCKEGELWCICLPRELEVGIDWPTTRDLIDKTFSGRSICYIYVCSVKK